MSALLIAAFAASLLAVPNIVGDLKEMFPPAYEGQPPVGYSIRCEVERVACGGSWLTPDGGSGDAAAAAGMAGEANAPTGAGPAGGDAGPAGGMGMGGMGGMAGAD